MSNKKFVFVNLSIDSGYYTVNMGIAYLIPVVRRNNFDVSVLHLSEEISEEAFKQEIQKLAPSVIGFSFTSPQAKFLKKYSRVIEDSFDILQIAGGVGATVESDIIMDRTSVDGLAIGEGEIPLDALLKTINQGGDIYQTKGFFWRRGDEIQKNEIPQFVADLDELDLPDYSYFDDKLIFNHPGGINVIVSRGCPYSCYYCSNAVLKGVYPSQKGYFRIMSVERSIQLLEKLIKEYPQTKHLGFSDDLLIANKKWFLSFAREYKKRIGLPYRLNVRVESVNEEIVAALKESGCIQTLVGLENGNEAFRKKFLNRAHSNREIVEKTGMIKKAGITVFTFNIVGFPLESRKIMYDTLRLNKKVKPDNGVCTFFYPLPGTKLYQICIDEGLMKKYDFLDMPNNYNTIPVVPPTAWQKRRCIRAQKKITKYLKRGTKNSYIK